MSLRFRPVHPNRSPSLAPDSVVSKVTLQSGIGLYSGLSVSCTNFKLEAMLELQFDFARFRANTDVQYFVVEMACYTPELLSVRARDGRISFIRKGVGFRIGVASWDVSMESAANLGAVAASVAIKGASSAHEVQTFGGNAIASLKSLREIQTLVELTPDTLKELAIAGSKVADLFASDPNLTPAEMEAAQLDVADKGPVSAALSMQFATESVYRKYSFLDAIDRAAEKATDDEKAHLNSTIVRAAYVEFGIDGPTEKPTDKEKQIADKILFLGR
jgi:hypothetical protein